MSKDKDIRFISTDTRQTKAEQDAVMGAGELMTVTPEQVMEFAKMARERKIGFDLVAKKKMTRERALRIKELRATLSWRGVAGITFLEWDNIEPNDEWYPETNQLMGMALCEAAAALLQENSEAYPWQATT